MATFGTRAPPVRLWVVFAPGCLGIYFPALASRVLSCVVPKCAQRSDTQPGPPMPPGLPWAMAGVGALALFWARCAAVFPYFGHQVALPWLGQLPSGAGLPAVGAGGVLAADLCRDVLLVAPGQWPPPRQAGGPAPQYWFFLIFVSEISQPPCPRWVLYRRAVLGPILCCSLWFSFLCPPLSQL